MSKPSRKEPGKPQAASESKNRWMKPSLILALAAVVAAVGFIVARGAGVSGETAAGAPQAPAAAAGIFQVPADQDLVIPVSGISATATFYPVEVDGTTLEVLAVRAPDGSIRTAFNTCQVCYSSGYGYYKQEGDRLVCQNCGNRFGMDQVEVASGGCNPVPIFPENKTVDAENITISRDFLAQAKVIFANWKDAF